MQHPRGSLERRSLARWPEGTWGGMAYCHRDRGLIWRELPVGGSGLWWGEAASSGTWENQSWPCLPADLLSPCDACQWSNSTRSRTETDAVHAASFPGAEEWGGRRLNLEGHISHLATWPDACLLSPFLFLKPQSDVLLFFIKHTHCSLLFLL